MRLSVRTGLPLYCTSTMREGPGGNVRMTLWGGYIVIFEKLGKDLYSCLPCLLWFLVLALTYPIFFWDCLFLCIIFFNYVLLFGSCCSPSRVSNQHYSLGWPFQHFHLECWSLIMVMVKWGWPVPILYRKCGLISWSVQVLIRTAWIWECHIIYQSVTIIQKSCRLRKYSRGKVHSW